MRDKIKMKKSRKEVAKQKKHQETQMLYDLRKKWTFGDVQREFLGRTKLGTLLLNKK
jgi:hypothetical protein